MLRAKGELALRRAIRIRSVWGVLALILPLAVVSVACDALGGSGGNDTPTGVALDGCAIPDVVGLDQATAQRRLVDLGIVPVRTDVPSDSVPEGHVVSIDPPAGTWLSPCSGEVSLVVSQGGSGEAREPTAIPEPTDMPEEPNDPGKQQAWPDQDDLPFFLTAFYEETFDDRFFGFRPEWSVDASEETVDSYATDAGELVVNGYLAAYVGDEYWYDYRITLGGGDYSNVDDFDLLARVQDSQNFVWVECTMADGWLTCAGHTVVDGEPLGGSGFAQTDGLCAAGQLQCDISLEAVQEQYRLLVNGEEKASFVDGTFSSGAVGFVVDGSWVLDYFHVLDPGSPASHPFTLFRDDFDTQGWYVGEDDGAYAATTYVISDSAYQWDVRAKAGVTVEQTREIRAAFHPNSFPYRFDLTSRLGIVSGPQGTAAGLLFRAQDYDNLYYFRMEDNGELDFFALEDSEWFHIAGPATSDWFVAGGENVLRVVADGSRFSFWLNGDFIMEAEDERFGMGAIGLAAELPNEGDVGIFAFDNVRLGVVPESRRE